MYWDKWKRSNSSLSPMIGAVIQRVGALAFVLASFASLWILALFFQRRQRRPGGQPREAVIEAAIRDERDARARAQGTSTGPA